MGLGRTVSSILNVAPLRVGLRHGTFLALVLGPKGQGMCPPCPESATVSLSPVSERPEFCMSSSFSNMAGADSGRLGLELAPTELKLGNPKLRLMMAPQCPRLEMDSFPDLKGYHGGALPDS